MEHLHVKNTFIEITPNDSDEDSQASLPRAFSDQSHARRAGTLQVPLVPDIASIPEESSETLSEKESSQRLDSEELQSLRTFSRPQVINVAHFPVSSARLTSLVPAFPSFILPVPSRVSTLMEIGDFRWHDESSFMGALDLNKKTFVKEEFDGRLSMVTESSVHTSGVHRYVVLIETGPVSVADGFGFIFNSHLPCKKNIQKIDSIFLNKKGKLCSRIRNELEMFNTQSLGNIDVGTIVELIIDLDSLVATFSIYLPPKGVDSETLAILARDENTFSTWLAGTSSVSIAGVVGKLDSGRPTGHFCAVLKNAGTTIRFL
jgi:hypothetical protein